MVYFVYLLTVKYFILNTINLVLYLLVGSSVEHIISHVICELDLENAHPSDYFLKLKHFSEYMLPMNTPVINFECVHECIKLDTDVELILLHKNDVVHIYARQVKLYINDNIYIIHKYLNSNKSYLFTFRHKMMFMIIN